LLTRKVTADPGRAGRVGWVLADTNENDAEVAGGNVLGNDRGEWEENGETDGDNGHLAENKGVAPSGLIGELGEDDSGQRTCNVWRDLRRISG